MCMCSPHLGPASATSAEPAASHISPPAIGRELPGKHTTAAQSNAAACFSSSARAPVLDVLGLFFLSALIARWQYDGKKIRLYSSRRITASALCPRRAVVAAGPACESCGLRAERCVRCDPPVFLKVTFICICVFAALHVRIPSTRAEPRCSASGVWKVSE